MTGRTIMTEQESEEAKKTGEEAREKPRNRYLMFCYSGVAEPEGNTFRTGGEMVTQCLDQIGESDDPELFPPKLFLLMVSPVYLENVRASRIFAGIQQMLVKKGHGNAALIGSSVAAVAFDGGVHPQGAVLVCLASRYLTAKVAAADDLTDAPSAMAKLAEKLGIFAGGADPNPNGNRSLLLFLPGPSAGLYDVDLHHHLLEAVQYQIPVFGGVSSANDATKPPSWDKPSLQFDADGPHRNSVVAALLESDFPIASNLARGLKKTGRLVKVKSIGDRRIESLEGGETWEELDTKKRGFVLLGESGAHGKEVIAVSNGYQSALLFRPARPGDELVVVEADPGEVLLASQLGVKAAMKRHGVQTPVGCLSFRCVGLYRRRQEIGLDFKHDIQSMEGAVGTNIIAGFMDGEAGIEESGQPVVTYWSAVRLVFGDELTHRAVRGIGYSALASHFARLAITLSLEQTISEALQTVRDAGFAGAMISLIVGPERNCYVVAQQAIGAGFGRILGETRRELDGTDVLAIVARTKEAKFVEDTLAHPDTEKISARKCGLVSQYILPLKDHRGDVLGVMQVDLGDLRRPRRLHKAVARVLEVIAAAVAASIAQVTASETARVIAALDAAFNRALVSDSPETGMQIFIDSAVDAFQANGGHVRWWEPNDNKLRLLAGKGRYYEAALKHRARIFTTDQSRSAECFLLRRTTIINHAQADGHTEVLVASNETPDDLKTELKRIGSFVNTPFFATATIAGTVTLHSESAWFFHTYRERSLEVLAERAGNLAAHLEARQKNEKADQALLDVKSRHERAEHELRVLANLQPYLKQFGAAAKLNDGLAELTSGLRKVFGADVASLFLFHKDLGQFILRGRDGWTDPGWIGAARYQPNQGWTGSVALLHGPAVFEDMNSYKRDTGRTTYGIYGREIWGPRIDDGITVRALAIPLRYGARMLGIVTLLVGTDGPGKRAFSTETPRILHKAATDIAGHLAAAIFSHEMHLASATNTGRVAVVQEFTDAFRTGDPAEVLCRRFTEVFGAREAVFYFADSAAADPRCEGAYPNSAKREADDPVRNAIRLGQSHCEHIGPQPHCRDPRQLAKLGVIRKAWIANPARGGALGVLAITWHESSVQDSPVTKGLIEELTSFGRMLGPAYQRYLDERKREQKLEVERKNDQAIRAMSIMISNSAHRFRNLLDQLEGARSMIETENTRERGLERISKILQREPPLVKRPLDVARKVARLSRRGCEVGELIRNVLGDYPGEDLDLIKLHVDPNCFAWVEPDVTSEAFRNIIDNALDAIRSKPGILTITATNDEAAKRVNILFHDTGIGMSQDKIDSVLGGFLANEMGDNPRGMGFGVLLSRVSTEIQDGAFELSSTESVGTRILIRFPMPLENEL